MRLTPDTETLRKNSQFRRAYGTKPAGDGLFAVFVRPNGLAGNRLGVTVSKKVGGAVTRNAVKRRVKEAYRACEPALDCGKDIVVLARPGAAGAAYADVRASLSRLFRRAGLRKEGSA